MEKPPTILFRHQLGPIAQSNDGRLIVYPGTIVHMECLWIRRFGTPKWEVSHQYRYWLYHHIRLLSPCLAPTKKTGGIDPCGRHRTRRFSTLQGLFPLLVIVQWRAKRARKTSADRVAKPIVCSLFFFLTWETFRWKSKVRPQHNTVLSFFLFLKKEISRRVDGRGRQGSNAGISTEHISRPEGRFRHVYLLDAD